jgi:peptidoglycan/xylan/chitin deacetylase (PgdA/CDA1 family)
MTRFVGTVLVDLARWMLCLLVTAPALAGHAAPGAPCEIHHGAITRGPTEEKRIALIFTGHGYAEGADTILGALSQRDAQASFFLTGDFLANPTFAPQVQRMVEAGHYIGPHSDKHLLYCEWNSERTTRVTREAFESDLLANVNKLPATSGGTPHAMRLFVPPFEHWNSEIAAWSRSLGWPLISFTHGTRSNADYTSEQDDNFVSSQVIYDSILEHEREDPNGLNGFLLLLHLGSGPDRTDKFHERFGALLDALASRGYEFVRVDELLEPCLAKASNPVFIRANQTGYDVGEPKVAIAFSEGPLPRDFQVIPVDGGGEPRYRAALAPVPEGRWGSFDHHAELDFSDLREPGRYVLKIGTNVSFPFRIGNDPDGDRVEPLLEFMRQQRCGFNPWLNTNCHQLDGRTAYGPLTNGTRMDARGGWHDAGDLLKYLLTSGNATAQMLLAHQLGGEHPAVTLDQVDARGLPGANGIPDLLDEARWGLDWMLKLHPEPEHLYHQVADDRDHAGWRLPQNDPVDYGWGGGKARVVYFADGKPQGLLKYQSESTGVANIAGRYAAAMALAYQTWNDQPEQREFAQRCLQAGREVYELGRQMEGVQQGNSYKAPYRYEETTWADDMEWGAAELFRATQEPRYLEEAKHYARRAADEGWMGRDEAGHYQYYPFMNVGHFRLHPLCDASLQAELEEYYRAGIERCLRSAEGNPYRMGAPFIWCSNNLIVALATQCELYERMSGDTRYRSFARKQRDWLLGRNPWGTTMFTGIGHDFPEDVHLMTTQLLKRPVRGGLVDGPVYRRIFDSLRGVSITQPDPLAAFQGEAVYHDDWKDYSSNEPTMDGTASAILLFALMGTAEP